MYAKHVRRHGIGLLIIPRVNFGLMTLGRQMSTAALQDVSFRAPSMRDGAAIHALVKESGLDINSAYAYLAVMDHFRYTSLVAFDTRDDTGDDGELLGMLLGYRVPARPDTLFVWQVAVAERARGKGLASHIITTLVQRNSGINYVEATVTPSNVPSVALFSGLGKHLNPARRAEIVCDVVEDHIPADSFPLDNGRPHEREDLLRVGPMRPAAAARAPGPLLVRDLDDVAALGNYKQSSRGKWESRRYLTRGDGFGYSFHVTIMYKDQSSFQWYPNHVESVYISKGHGTIEIVDAGTPEDYEHAIGTGRLYELQEGRMYALEGQRHILTALSEGGMECHCVFNPPVVGMEDHNAVGAYPAIDDAGRSYYGYGVETVPRLFKPPAAFEEGSEWCQ